MMGGRKIRMIMHDMSNLPIDEPGGTELNRSTLISTMIGIIARVVSSHNYVAGKEH